VSAITAERAARLFEGLRPAPDVAFVGPPRIAKTGRAAMVTVNPRSGPDAPATPALVKDLRDRVIPIVCDSGYHPSGTVPLGRAPGESAAVDGRGRVFGADALYVVDARLMPTIPSSNIHLPTLMIAERMAEWLDAEL